MRSPHAPSGSFPPPSGPAAEFMWRATILMVVVSWAMFQGLPTLVGQALPADPFDLIPNYGLLAVVSLAAFLAGTRVARGAIGEAPSKPKSHETALDAALGPATLYLWLSAPAVVPWAAFEAWRTATQGYGNVDTISRPLNLALYVNLSLLPILFWSRDVLGARRYWALILIIVLPRLLISLGGQRFFVLQAVIPVTLWELGRLRRLLTPQTVAAGVLAVFALFYVVPALRGDAALGFANLVAGSPLGFAAAVENTGVLQANTHSELVTCEVVANITTVDVCSLRDAFGVPEQVPVRLDQAATFHVREITGLDAIGTGGNPVIEAFPTGRFSWGLAYFLLAGSLLCWTVRNSTSRPFACYLLPHVTAKSLFLWRGTLSELFERIPLILISYAMMWAVVRTLVNRDASRTRA